MKSTQRNDLSLAEIARNYGNYHRSAEMYRKRQEGLRNDGLYLGGHNGPKWPKNRNLQNTYLRPIWTVFFDRIDTYDSSLESLSKELSNELSYVSIRSKKTVQMGLK